MSTLDMIPWDSMFFSSALTASLSWSGIFLAVYRDFGLVFGVSCIV